MEREENYAPATRGINTGSAFILDCNALSNNSVFMSLYFSSFQRFINSFGSFSDQTILLRYYSYRKPAYNACLYKYKHKISSFGNGFPQLHDPESLFISHKYICLIYACHTSGNFLPAIPKIVGAISTNEISAWLRTPCGIYLYRKL